METLEALLPGAVLAGQGAVLGALGYRIVRFHTMTLGVFLFAALGAAAGGFAQSPLLAVVLAVAGAMIGYALRPVLFHIAVALAAAAAGVAIGTILARLTGYSNPLILCVACAVGCAIIALLDVRAITIAWTSAAGAAMATLGVLHCAGYPLHLPYVGTGALFVLLLVLAALFQARTTREDPAPQPAPSLPPLQ